MLTTTYRTLSKVNILCRQSFWISPVLISTQQVNYWSDRLIRQSSETWRKTAVKWDTTFIDFKNVCDRANRLKSWGFWLAFERRFLRISTPLPDIVVYLWFPSVLPGKCLDGTSNLATTTSFNIIILVNHTVIQSVWRMATRWTSGDRFPIGARSFSSPWSPD